MRYAISTKDEVRLLRKKGLSLGEISSKTHIPKTTIRLWIKDISLTTEQQKRLASNTQQALQKGRVIFQNQGKKQRLVEEKQAFSLGKEEIRTLSSQEFFLTGVALYWAEGFKNIHEHRLGFCNSDPEMIVFYLAWLESLGVNKTNITARLTLNIAYKEKVQKIEKYWSERINIPLVQFTKPFYQKTQWKKEYKTDNYYGVLRIHVKDSIKLLWRMKGWITGLKHAKIGSTYLPG